jgi:DNA-binding beta-propeller fold protein YncE
MSAIDRRQGLWMLGAGAAAATAIGLGTMARAATNSRTGTLALVEKKAGRLAFYALPGGRLLGSVALGTQPHEIAADATGRFAYVGHYGVAGWKAPGAGGDKIWVIDLHKRALARTIDLAPYGRLHAVRIDAAGRLYALSEKDSLLARFDDPTSDDAPTRLIPVNGARSHYMVVRRDGTRVYVADTMSGAVIMVDPEDMGTAPVRRRIGTAPEGLALSADERTLYVIDRPASTLHAVDATTLEERARRPMRGEAVRIVTLRDGTLVVSNSADKSLSRRDPVTLEEEGRLALPAAAPGLNLAGETIYASLEDDRVMVVDTRSWHVVDRFATGPGPDAAVVF